MNFLKKLFFRHKEKPVELPPEFLEENPPDWLLVFKGQHPLTGQVVSIRVQLSNASRTGTAEIIALPDNPDGQPQKTAVELAQTDVARLFVILGFSFPDDIADVSAEIDDGQAVELSIYRADPFAIATARCNIANDPDLKKSHPPTAEIALLLGQIMKRRLPL